ncbi:sensor histidine kinase [Actinophytocola sp.]|uniref:sensor histidine kinase n=1 Tax=Actinophytocola sp. TaxID=1872138 RepID=UPI002D52C0AB|nr:ATP-binding protein [Actinophytocola sp.]HYQ68544.1 ATP-binding protein [Actinophytocola sp.]
MSDAPTPPWGIRVEHDVRNEYADGIERLQTRLLHIGLFLLTVVMLGGGAGVLMVVTDDSRALGVSIAVVAGCVVAVLVAFLAAMSATRRLSALARSPRPVAAARPVPRPEPVAPQQEPLQPEARPVESRQEAPAPLWARPGEQQVTLTDDPGQRREVFVKLARRLQSLINRAIKRIDELEQDNEDPELLDGLYEIDHLFTLARRQGENLAVLGGEAPQRRSNKPVSVYAVLLAAVSEAEHYRQIAIVPVEDVEIHGHAVAEIIHLLAELLENATRFSAPDGPKVEVRAHKVTAGLAIEVQDRGLGMLHEDLERINHLLDGSTRIDLSELLEDGRIGLAVVRELARRHSIRVRLQSNIFGGIAAAVVIPPQLLSVSEPESRHRAAAPQQQQQRPSALPRRRSELDAATPSPTPRTGGATESSPALTPARGPEPARTPTPVPQEARSDGGPPSLSVPTFSQADQPSTPVASLAPGERSGPVQVPAPLPIPTASLPASPGLGPVRPGQQATRHRVVEGTTADELPVLPVRAPGRSYDDLRTGGDGVLEEMDAQLGEQPPPLPQRRGSHLREELREPPSPTRPVPGHNTNLMKTVQAGREHWFANREQTNENRGDQWPTT